MINSVDNKVISVKISISKNRFQLKAKQYLHKWIFEKENRQERPRQFFCYKIPRIWKGPGTFTISWDNPSTVFGGGTNRGEPLDKLMIL